MKENTADRAFNIINYVLLILISFATLFPFLLVVGTSVTPPEAIMSKANSIINIPYKITFEYYKYILHANSPMFGAFGITVLRTVLGTAINLLLTALTAYPLSKRYLPGVNGVMKLFIFTMLFSGGMIPIYLLVRSLNIINTIWALVLPGALNVYNLIILRTFFRSIPEEVEESAKIDGCSDLGILFRIVLPLSLPAIASIGLFYGVWHWNSFMDAVLYINDRALWPMQLLLREILLTSSVSELDLSSTFADSVPPPGGLIAATIVITSLPIICVYPFLQKYFVKGVMIGSVKG